MADLKTVMASSSATGIRVGRHAIVDRDDLMVAEASRHDRLSCPGLAGEYALGNLVGFGAIPRPFWGENPSRGSTAQR
jgi:hypothetical protein